jgi:hypothetical protein
MESDEKLFWKLSLLNMPVEYKNVLYKANCCQSKNFCSIHYQTPCTCLAVLLRLDAFPLNMLLKDPVYLLLNYFFVIWPSSYFLHCWGTWQISEVVFLSTNLPIRSLWVWQKIHWMSLMNLDESEHYYEHICCNKRYIYEIG